MPDVLVEVRGSWIGSHKVEFLDAIHAAITDVLKTPADDKVLRLVEHATDQFICPRNGSDRFTRIEIVMFTGRSAQAKRALYRSIVQQLVPFGVPEHDVKIVLVEVPKYNVGLRGGRAASDIDLGYEVAV